MKKMLIGCFIMSTMAVSQTGMIANDGESSMGVYLSASVLNVENADADPMSALGFGYMSKNGVELSLSYLLENGSDGVDWNPITVSITKHIKNIMCVISFVPWL